MLFENVYNRVLEQHTTNVPPELEKYAKIFFEAGVKAALGERTQQPVLLKGNPNES